MPVSGRCQGCNAAIQLIFEGGAARQVTPCDCTTRKGKPSELLARHLAERQGRATGKVVAGPWSAAKPTDCARGHRHGSRLEARLCATVHDAAPPDARVFVHARVPLWALGVDERGRPVSYFTPDFIVMRTGKQGRLEMRACFDAKGRSSREWRRGRAAFKESYGVDVAEIRSIDQAAQEPATCIRRPPRRA